MKSQPARDAIHGDLPSARYLELGRRSPRELEEAFLRGSMPDLDALVGWEFRGMNVGRLPKLARIRKFVKGFERKDGGAHGVIPRDPVSSSGGDRSGGDKVVGYNRPVEQNRLDAPWHAGERRFGWYRVAAVDPTARDNAYLHAALLDYGRGDNPLWDPSRGLRDYLVQVEAGDRDLYLGKAFYALGPGRVPLSFFVLERLRPAVP
jgi:hypothetical protein